MIGLAALALVLVVGAAGVRRPWVAIAAYGAVLPVGSALVLPGPGPTQLRTLSTALAVVLLVALAVRLVVHGEGRAPAVPAIGALVLFLAIAVATTAWSEEPRESARAVVLLVVLMAVLLAVSTVSLEQRGLRRVELVIAVVGGLVGLYGVWLALNGALPDAGEAAGRFATAGGTGDEADPNITAAALLLPLVLGAAGALRHDRLRRRLLLGASACGSMAGVVLTGSRGGVLAALVAGAVLVWQAKPRPGAVAALAAAGVLAGLAAVPAGLTDRLTEGTSTGRAAIWEIGLVQCKAHCLTGAGLETFPGLYREALLADPTLTGHGDKEYRAHNLWLALSLETGVLGTALVALAVLLLLLQVRRLPPSRRGPPLAVLVALLVSNMFLNNLTFKYFWFALTFAVLCLRAQAQPVPEPARRRAR